MKYFTRSNIYKASNVTFNPETIEAFSYDWWRFVAKIEGKVVFNNYRYSVSTAGHQRKVERLMQNLGIKIDLFLQIPKGIQAGQTLADLYVIHGQTLKQQSETTELKKLARNKKAREKRAQAKIEAAMQKLALPKLTIQNIGGN